MVRTRIGIGPAKLVRTFSGCEDISSGPLKVKKDVRWLRFDLKD